MADDSDDYSSDGGDSFDGDELDSAIETAQERLKGAANAAGVEHNLPGPRAARLLRRADELFLLTIWQCEALASLP